nr:MAG TPA: hypothetical protein [Caudoviricetes sp.]
MRELTMASIYITSSRPGAILSYHNMHTEHKKNNSIRRRRNKHERV